MFEIVEKNGNNVVQTDEDLTKNYLCIDEMVPGQVYELGEYVSELRFFETDGVSKTMEDWWEKLNDRMAFNRKTKTYMLSHGEKFAFIGTLENKQVKAVKQYGILSVNSQNLKIGFLHEKDKRFVAVKS